MKPRMKIHVGRASHFLQWELPFFRQFFEIVDDAGDDVILFVFGPDALFEAVTMPALFRVALLFPGFGWNPYFNLDHREVMKTVIEEYYDIIFVNPGPTMEAFKDSSKIATCGFSIDVEKLYCTRPRTTLNTLLHASADYPQKDWRRSKQIMSLTGLKHEVFPPRPDTQSFVYKLSRRINHYRERVEAAVMRRVVKKQLLFRPPKNKYVDHKTIIKKYCAYDGFVHVAAKTPPYVDGKYTATLLEAGVTGSILFWHDTLELGNDFETIFDIPLAPHAAAERILEIRANIDIQHHSRRTREEITDKCNPQSIVKSRYEKIKERL